MSLFEKFYLFEEDFDLNKFYLNNIWIYPLLKMLIFQALFQKTSSLETKKKSKLSLLLELKKTFYWQKIKSKEIKTTDYLYVIDGITRRLNENNQYGNIYVSPIINHLNHYKHLVFEFPDEDFGHYSPIPEKYVFYPDLSIKWILFKTKFFKKEWFPESLLKEVNLFFETNLSSQYVNSRIDKFFTLKNYFIHLIANKQPKLIFLVNAYDYKKMAMIAAAKELNIKTVELQHGIIYDSHLAYFYHKVLGRDLLPDYLFTYGNYFKKLIVSKSKAFVPENVISVGFPYMEQISKNKPVLPEKISDLSRSKKIILITSQWVIRDQLKNFTKAICKILPKDYHIIYKTHPGERDIEETYHDLMLNNVTLVTEKSISSLELMKIADIHTTVFSTSLFESFMFGLPNILIEIPEYSKNITGYIDNKSVFLVNSPKDYIERLRNITKKYEYHKKCAQKNCAQFFEPNALLNIAREIKKLSG